MTLGLSTFRIYPICVLFLSRLRFPSQDSIIKNLRRRYDNCLAKKVQKCKKFDFKYRKKLLNMEFLQPYKKEKLIPKFLQFKRVNNRLESFEAYLSCQRRLLNHETSIKYKTILTLNEKITSMKNNLHSKISFIDYKHVITNILMSNSKNICKIRKNQGKKLHNLFSKNSYHNLKHVKIQIRQFFGSCPQHFCDTS